MKTAFLSFNGVDPYINQESLTHKLRIIHDLEISLVGLIPQKIKGDLKAEYDQVLAKLFNMCDGKICNLKQARKLNQRLHQIGQQYLQQIHEKELEQLKGESS